MDLQSEIKQLLETNAKELVDQDGAFCTGFFLAAEFYGSDGNYYSLSIKEDTMPPWRVEGLVNYELSQEAVSEESDYDG